MHESEIGFASVEQLLEAIGRRLREEKRRLRVDGKRLSDGALARRAGVSRSTVTRLWQGEPIGTDNLIRLLRALGRLDLLYALLSDRGPTPVERLAKTKQPRRRLRPAEEASAPAETSEIAMADARAFRDKYKRKQ